MTLLSRLKKYNDVTKEDKFFMCLGGPSRVGKSYVSCATWPKQYRILQLLTILDAQGYESGKRKATRLSIYLDDDNNIIENMTERYNNALDMLEDPAFVEEIVKNFDVIVADGINWDHIIHKHINCIPNKDRGVTKFDVWPNVTDLYVRLFQALKGLHERGLHIICNLTYEESDDRFMPTIQGKTGIKVPSWFPDVLFLTNGKDGKALWSVNKVVRKESSSYGGESGDHVVYENVVGGRLGRFPIRALEGKPASMTGLLQYVKNGGRWPEVKKTIKGPENETSKN